jgi:hypothetical protein
MQIAYERLDLLQNDISKIVIITKYLLLIIQALVEGLLNILGKKKKKKKKYFTINSICNHKAYDLHWLIFKYNRYFLILKL